MEASTGSKIVVAEDGNKRTAISAEDVQQTLNDLAEWFKSNAANYFDKSLKDRQGAEKGELDAVLAGFGVSSTSHLALSLSKFNGGL